MQIGHFNRLRIIQFTDHGAILDADGKDILMPKKYVTDDMHAGDEVDVFIYIDQSGRLVATKETPLAEVGQFAFLEVAWTNRFGAFMNWGLMKDLFVPFSEQGKRFVQGRSYWVYIYIDEKTGRIVGTSKIDRYISDDHPNFSPGQEVDAFVWKQTDLGYKVIVESTFEGLIYRNETFSPIHIGDKLKAIVKQVRDDGKIDLSLQPSGKKLITGFANTLMRELYNANGYLPYGDHSPADEIADRFHVSKKTFKKTIGALYRQRAIEITDDGICFAKQPED